MQVSPLTSRDTDYAVDNAVAHLLHLYETEFAPDAIADGIDPVHGFEEVLARVRERLLQ